MSCRRGCGRDFNRERMRYDNRGLYESLRYTPFDRPIDHDRGLGCRRGDRLRDRSWVYRYPCRYR